jgi:uncharacterized protein YdaU (DUF1376 family)
MSMKEWKTVRPVVVEFFTVKGGVWRHKRIDQELQNAVNLVENKVKVGKLGAEKRWQKHGKDDGKQDGRTHGRAMAKWMANGCTFTFTLTTTFTEERI